MHPPPRSRSPLDARLTLARDFARRVQTVTDRSLVLHSARSRRLRAPRDRAPHLNGEEALSRRPPQKTREGHALV
jgi:hypothetical protein